MIKEVFLIKSSFAKRGTLSCVSVLRMQDTRPDSTLATCSLENVLCWSSSWNSSFCLLNESPRVWLHQQRATIEKTFFLDLHVGGLPMLLGSLSFFSLIMLLASPIISHVSKVCDRLTGWNAWSSMIHGMDSCWLVSIN